MSCRALLVVCVALAACGKDKPRGSEGGDCYLNATCDPPLWCNRNGICARTTSQTFVTVNVSAGNLLEPAGIEICGAQAVLGATLQATLTIAGHEPCALAVNSSTLTASGACEGITVGILRPVLLTYFVVRPATSEDVTLAYLAGFIDLSEDVVGEATSVSLSLAADGVASVQVETPAQAAALPEASACVGATGVAANRCQAEVYLKDYLSQEPSNALDYDNDSTANLQEACDGTLF